MIGTGVFTAVERRRAGPALGWVMLLTLLMGSGVSAAELLNPSFETTYLGMPYPRSLPQSWYHVDHASFNSYCSNSWCTNGTLSVGLFSLKNKAVSPGNYASFYQYVDLTGIGAIKFDVRLAALPNGGTFEHFEASFLVDGVPLWSQKAGGVYLDQEVNVTGMADWHCIEMRNTALDTGTFDPAYWTQWDSLRLIEGPTTIPAEIDLEPDTLHLHGPGKWVACFIELPANYDVNDIDEATVTLQGIPACLGKEGPGPEAWHKSRITDRDGDGLPERLFKFDQDAVRAIVQPPEAILIVKGSLADKTLFEGSATIKVVDKLAELKAKLEELKAKVQDARGKRQDDKKGCGDDKDKRDKSRDSSDKCRDNDDKGRDKDDKCRDNDDKGAGKKR